MKSPKKSITRYSWFSKKTLELVEFIEQKNGPSQNLKTQKPETKKAIDREAVKKQKKKYWEDVMRITKAQNLQELEGYENRLTIFELKKYGNKAFGMKRFNHLDHKISIAYGFKNGIPANVIGHISNLRYIPGDENLAKGTKCVFD